MPQAAIIIFGPGGCGKTTWAASVTKPEATRVLAFEGTQEDVLPAGVESIDVMAKYDPFDAESVKLAITHLQREMSRAKKDAQSGSLRCLVLDGFNAMAEAAAQYATEKEPNTSMRSGPIAARLLTPIMLSLHRMPCLVILTAHEAGKYAKDGDGKGDTAPTGTQPQIGGGGLRTNLPSYVSDIWHMSQLGKVRKFLTQASGATGPDAKSRLKKAEGSAKVPLVEPRVLVEDAAKALRVYMGWTKVAVGPAKVEPVSPETGKPAPKPATGVTAPVKGTGQGPGGAAKPVSAKT